MKKTWIMFFALSLLVTSLLLSSSVEAKMVDDGRRWSQEEFAEIMDKAIQPVLLDVFYPDDDPYINGLLPNIRLIQSDYEINIWKEEAYALTEKGIITPSYWCNWLFYNTDQSYGGKILKNGELRLVRSLEEIWEDNIILLGNAEKEPFCPEFVTNGVFSVGY